MPRMQDHEPDRPRDAAANLLRRGRFLEWCDQAERHSVDVAAVDGDPYRTSGPDPVETADRLHELGRWQWHAARFVAAERNLTGALALRERFLGAEDSRTLDTRERIAALHHYTAREDAAERFEQVLALRAPGTLAEAVTRRNWGAALRDREDGRAEGVLTEACALIERQVGVEHPEHAAALKAHAFCVLRRDPTGHQSLGLAARAHSASQRCHPDDHPFVASALLMIARAELRECTVRGSVNHRKAAAARRHLDEVAASFARSYGESHPLVAILLVACSNCAAADGDLDGALVAREQAVAVYARTYPAGQWLAGMMLEVARLHLRRHDPDAAMSWIARAAPAVSPLVVWRRFELVEQCIGVAETWGDEALAATLRAARREIVLEEEGAGDHVEPS